MEQIDEVEFQVLSPVFPPMNIANIKFEQKTIRQLIDESYEAGRKEMLQKSLSILDEAELKKWFDMSDTTENWKTWKRIRNNISDALKLKEIKE